MNIYISHDFEFARQALGKYILLDLVFKSCHVLALAIASLGFSFLPCKLEIIKDKINICESNFHFLLILYQLGELVQVI